MTDPSLYRSALAQILSLLPEKSLGFLLTSMTDDAAPVAFRVALDVRKDASIRDLMELMSNPNIEIARRVRAAWLLKDGVSATLWPTLKTLVKADGSEDALVAQVIDVIERLLFSRLIPVHEVRCLSPHVISRRNPETMKRWIRMLGTMADDWAIDQLIAIGTSHAAFVDDVASTLASLEGDHSMRGLVLLAEQGNLSSRSAVQFMKERVEKDILESAQKVLSTGEQMEDSLLEALLFLGKYALITKLANSGRLTAKATDLIMAHQPKGPLSRSQRRFFGLMKEAALKKGIGNK